MRFKNNNLKKVCLRLEQEQIDSLTKDGITEKIGFNKKIRNVIDEYYKK